MNRKVAALLLALCMALSAFAGCGMQKAQSRDEANAVEDAAGGFYEGDANSAESPQMYEDGLARPGGESSALSGMVSELTYGEDVKLIFSASMDLQTLDFAKTEQELDALVKKHGAYFESVDASNGDMYSSYGRKNGFYVVRVPAENYDAFLSEVGGSCHVVNLHKASENVGLAYSDTQTRLRTERAKQERYLALLSKAEEMEDIIQLESAISNCQYNIDSLSSDIERYDSLISYSTVNISLVQVERLSGSIDEEESFAGSLLRNFKEGAQDFFYTMGELLSWIAYNVLGIAAVVAIAVIAVKLFKRRAARCAREGGSCFIFRRRKNEPSGAGSEPAEKGEKRD